MLNILYEDNHLIVCVKPKGILSQADGSSKSDMLTTLKKYIKEKYNKPNEVYLGLVHRLDINTSGIMVFARTSKAAARLSDAIKNHEFKKRYIATVEGELYNSDYIELKSFITKDESLKKAIISNVGSEAILEYKALCTYNISNTVVTDVDITLKTGRFHQIRAQMASIGHPLYGDKKYGSKNHVDDFNIPLCAYYLSFPHPTKKEILEFEIAH